MTIHYTQSLEETLESYLPQVSLKRAIDRDEYDLRVALRTTRDGGVTARAVMPYGELVNVATGEEGLAYLRRHLNNCLRAVFTDWLAANPPEATE